MRNKKPEPEPELPVFGSKKPEPEPVEKNLTGTSLFYCVGSGVPVFHINAFHFEHFSGHKYVYDI